MKRAFNIIMSIVFVASLALFISLSIAVIILGPQRTEDSIQELFQAENYKRTFYKTLVITKKTNNTSEDENTEEETLAIDREIQDLSKIPPLLVPSSGIAPRSAFLYTGPLGEGKHEGIDIWTQLNGTGMDGKTYGKGNPVYAACSGYVHNVWEENGDVVINCNKLDEIYKDTVTSLTIKTLYGHMADQFSDRVYIYVRKGQKINKGDLIGHQGNRCYWSPQNKVVHLHFGVYDISVQPQVPLDPTPYIGVSCTTLNQRFEAGVE